MADLKALLGPGVARRLSADRSPHRWHTATPTVRR